MLKKVITAKIDEVLEEKKAKLEEEVQKKLDSLLEKSDKEDKKEQK